MLFVYLYTINTITTINIKTIIPMPPMTNKFSNIIILYGNIIIMHTLNTKTDLCPYIFYTNPLDYL